MKMKTNLYVLSLFTAILTEVRALRCYQCAKTSGISGQDANTQCLSEGSEITCPGGQDRCYTVLTGASRNEVTKGCRRNRECTQNIVCCLDDFCNAGLGLYPQTGYGKTCDTVADCVQGITDMRCDTLADDTNQKQCLCLDSSYNIRAACVPKKGLSEFCASKDECRGENTDCNGEICVCQLGYKHMNGSDTCFSGTNRIFSTSSESWSLVITSFISLYIAYL